MTGYRESFGGRQGFSSAGQQGSAGRFQPPRLERHRGRMRTYSGRRQTMPILFGRHLLAHQLHRFFGQEPYELPVVSHSFSPVDLPNLHIALEQYVQERGAQMRIIGYSGAMPGMHDSLSDMIGRKGWLLSSYMSI